MSNDIHTDPLARIRPKEKLPKADWVPTYLLVVGYVTASTPFASGIGAAIWFQSLIPILYSLTGLPAAGIFFALARLVERSETQASTPNSLVASATPPLHE